MSPRRRFPRRVGRGVSSGGARARGWDSGQGTGGVGVDQGIGTRGRLPPRRLDAAAPRKSRAWVLRELGEGSARVHRGAWVRPGKGAALSTSTAARDAALGARLLRENHGERGAGEH